MPRAVPCGESDAFATFPGLEAARPQHGAGLVVTSEVEEQPDTVQGQVVAVRDELWSLVELPQSVLGRAAGSCCELVGFVEQPGVIRHRGACGGVVVICQRDVPGNVHRGDAEVPVEDCRVVGAGTGRNSALPGGDRICCETAVVEPGAEHGPEHRCGRVEGEHPSQRVDVVESGGEGVPRVHGRGVGDGSVGVVGAPAPECEVGDVRCDEWPDVHLPERLPVCTLFGEAEDVQRLRGRAERGVLEGDVQQDGGVVADGATGEVPSPLVERVDRERFCQQDLSFR